MVNETTPLVSATHNRRSWWWCSGPLLAVLVLGAVALGVTISVRRSEKHSTRGIEEAPAPPVVSFTITSPAFSNGDSIPSAYSRKDGENRPPPLQWEGVPEGTKSLALIVDDPDAPDPDHPKTTWVHWVAYNIPPKITGLDDSSPKRFLQGRNDWKKMRYDGPQPPKGVHRYFFKLYALDKVLPNLGESADKHSLKSAMKGHILDKAELMGTYQKG